MAEKYLENQKKEQEEPGPSTGADSTAERDLDKEEVPGIVVMSKVDVKPDSYGGAGVFTKVDLKKGQLIEKGIIRVLPLDGNDCPFVFTWSEGEPRKWGSGSGASVFYNMSETPNTHMERDFDKNSFEIHATRDIVEGEELTHVYI